MNNRSREDSRKWLLVAGVCFIVLMTVAAYIPAMQGGFVWDDDDYVTNNPLLTAPDGLKRIWLSLDSPSQYFPLVYTTFRMEHALWGFNPLGYHIVNVLLHAINALLVWWVLRRLSVPGAWLAAAIFALHPVHAESVAWITERKNVLSTMFYLLAVLAFLRFTGGSGHQRRYYALAIILYALALFGKTTACTLPAALLLILWLSGERVGWRRLAQIVPFVILGAAMGMVSIWWEQHHQGTVGQEFAYGAAERILIASRALWFYVGKLVWPAKLAFSYPRWEIDSGNPLQYGWLIGCIVVAAGLWRLRRMLGRGPLVALAFFAVSLTPMLGFVSLYTFRYSFVADHYQYVASIGVIALFAAFVARRWRQPGVEYGMRYALPVVVLLTIGVLTWRQGHAYSDGETLWRDTLAKCPSSWLAHNNLAHILDRRGELDEAIFHYSRAVEAKPDLMESHLNLGIALTAQGRFEEAVGHYTNALELMPDFSVTHYNLGVALTRWGRLDEAIAHYRKAVQLEPSYAEAHDNLGVALIAQGKVDEAVAHLRAALEIQPDNARTHNNMAAAFYHKGMYAEAWKEILLCRQHGGEPHPGLVQVLSQRMAEPGE